MNKSELQKIIKEEVSKVLSEMGPNFSPDFKKPPVGGVNPPIEEINGEMEIRDYFSRPIVDFDVQDQDGGKLGWKDVIKKRLRIKSADFESDTLKIKGIVVDKRNVVNMHPGAAQGNTEGSLFVFPDGTIKAYTEKGQELPARIDKVSADEVAGAYNKFSQKNGGKVSNLSAQTILQKAPVKETSLKELSPNTYDSAIDAGSRRGDPRGDRIAGQAMDLKLKQAFGGKPIKVHKGHNSIELTPLKLKKGSPNTIWIKCLYKSDGNSQEIDMVLQEDGKLLLNGGKYFVDRPTANMLAKIYNAAYGDDKMKPNMIPQT